MICAIYAVIDVWKEDLCHLCRETCLESRRMIFSACAVELASGKMICAICAVELALRRMLYSYYKTACIWNDDLCVAFVLWSLLVAGKMICAICAAKCVSKNHQSVLSVPWSLSGGLIYEG